MKPPGCWAHHHQPRRQAGVGAGLPPSHSSAPSQITRSPRSSRVRHRPGQKGASFQDSFAAAAGQVDAPEGSHEVQGRQVALAASAQEGVAPGQVQGLQRPQ